MVSNLLKSLIKKYFASFVYFYRFLKHRLFVVIFLGIIIGSLDAFGLTMFLPLLELASGSEAATGENLGGLTFFVDSLNNTGIQLTLWIALLILAIFFILKGIAVYLSDMYKVKVSQFFISTMRLNLTVLFTRFSFKSFVSADMGRIQNAFTSEVSRVSAAYNSYSQGIQQLIMTLVYMSFVFIIDWKFALLVCVGGVLTNFFYSRIYTKTKDESRKISLQNSNYHKSIIQYINNFKYLKATGFLKTYSEKLQSDIKNIENTNRKIGALNARITAIREPVLIIIVCLVILVQVYLLGGQLATILMSLLLFYRALTQLMLFQQTYNSFLANSGSLDNVTDFEKELRENSERDGKIVFDTFNKSLKLKDVTFKYGRTTILKNINIDINSNESIAFVGESGSGKTTLVNVLSGLLAIDKGTFEVDGVPISSLKRDTYQRRIGYIAQESVIFNDSIFDNVTFWDGENPDSKERFEKAINQASIDDFIETLPDKEETLLGNNGINLSGGQKQRISIARELYKDIDILILDEATSALDSETEKAIQENIDKLKGKYTIIIIAHRLSTIRNVDKVYLMDNGEISASGTFEELIEKSPRFKKMVELQEL